MNRICYERIFRPLCRVCNSAHRDEIEVAYIVNHHSYKAAHERSKQSGCDIGYDAVANHINNHCQIEDGGYLGSLRFVDVTEECD